MLQKWGKIILFAFIELSNMSYVLFLKDAFS